jgi:MFS transporter, FHS family, L-fucose permease
MLFFLWGFITVLVDSLIPRLKDIFELTYFQAGTVQFAFFIAYFLFAIPAGFILHKVGYQKGIVIGLITMSVGCLLFYPAASFREFSLFLVGYFTLAAGITFLQVAANPYVIELGPEKSASSRLNLSQAFNSLGTSIAPLIGAAFLLNDSILSSNDLFELNDEALQLYYMTEASAVQKPFIIIALLIGVLAFFFSLIKLPIILNAKVNYSYSEVFTQKSLLLGALGIFLYVGAEVAIGSYLVNYFLEMNMAFLIMENDLLHFVVELFLASDVPNEKAIVGIFVSVYWLNAMLGRFLGAYLTRVFSSSHVLSLFAFLAMFMLLISMNSLGFVAMFSILGVGLFNSIMFPTIFSLSISNLGSLKPLASGLLVTAVVGGAIIPPLYGLLADEIGLKAALYLIILCYGYILYFAWRNSKKSGMA